MKVSQSTRNTLEFIANLSYAIFLNSVAVSETKNRTTCNYLYWMIVARAVYYYISCSEILFYFFSRRLSYWYVRYSESMSLELFSILSGVGYFISNLKKPCGRVNTPDLFTLVFIAEIVRTFVICTYKILAYIFRSVQILTKASRTTNDIMTYPLYFTDFKMYNAVEYDVYDLVIQVMENNKMILNEISTDAYTIISNHEKSYSNGLIYYSITCNLATNLTDYLDRVTTIFPYHRDDIYSTARKAVEKAVKDFD